MPKKSKLQRKFINQMRAMGDVPWPARKYRVAPMFGDSKRIEVGTCPRQVDEVKIKQGRFKRQKTVPVVCGGKVVVKIGSLAKRRVYCESCRQRRRERKLQLRLEQQMRRYGVATQREVVREERRATRMLRRLRLGSR